MSARYPVPDLNTLPEDIRTKILAVQEKAGFIPNVFLGFARRPAEWRAFFAYHDALMEPETAGRTSNLTKGDREMIVTTTSAANKCLYCVVAHGAILRIYEKKPFVADQVAVNHRKADITPRQRAMLDFAMKVCLQSHEINDADFEALHAHGFDDEDIWDIAAITAFFGLSNRMASFAGMQPNPEFYLMGRVPRQKRNSWIDSYWRLLDNRWRPISLEISALLRLPAASALHAVTNIRIQSGRVIAFCCGKSTQMVVAPPAAYTTPGWSLRSSVHQASKVVRPGSLTYIFASTSPGYSSCLLKLQKALTITGPWPCGSGLQPTERIHSMRTVSM